MGFNIEQLRWLSSNSIKFSKKVVAMANNVEKLSGDNSKNAQRINGGIAELASVSENLNNIRILNLILKGQAIRAFQFWLLK